jgi:exodeoxyribonuclease VII small subunit
MGDAKRGARGAGEAPGNQDKKPGTTPSQQQDDAVSKGAESLSFEGALDQLEQTVARLEGGDMPLEEALELFEAGVQLSRQCNQTLEAAERRIEVLIADRADSTGALAVEAFDSDDDLDEDGADDEDDDADDEDDFED